MPDPAIDPTTALAPPPAWTPPTASPSPMDTTPATMGGVPALPPPTQPTVTQQQPQTTPASQDPEVAAGHAHQSWLGHILDVVGSILGGDQTIHVTKAPDGTMTVTHDPSTSGEKWARVAQAAMLGGAQGLAHGQGPGGMANAIAAGTMTGAALPQQQLTAANEEATAANKQMMTKAQHALLDQQIATQQLQNKELPLEYQRQKQTFALEQIGRLRDMGALHVANTKNPQEMAQFGNSDPLSMAAHTGASDDVMQPVAMPDGSVDWWRIPADRAKQLTTDRATWDEMVHDPKDYGNIITKTHVVDPGTETYGARALREKGAAATNEKVQTDAATYRVNKQKADTEALNAQGKPALTQAQTQEAQARAVEASANAAKARATLPGLPGGAAEPIDDPSHPPAANFDPGTVGIVPKNIGKIPADTAKAARLSRNIQHNGQIINELMTRRPDLVGTINSLGTNWQQKVTGTNDPDLAALDGAVDQLAIASAGAHGSRAAGLVEGIHDGVLNHFKNGPAAVKAYTQGQMNSVQTFIDEENNYRHYGDPVGPSTAAKARAIARAPGGATAPPTPPAGGGATVVPPGAAVQGFTPMTPPAGQTRPGYQYGTGPQGKGWYKQ